MATDSGFPTGDPGSAYDLRSRVRQELDRLRELARRLSLEEVRQGEWFTKLLKSSLEPYVAEVDADYFDRLYPGLSAEARIRDRIELAARAASMEGALTAGAYNGALAATLGSRGTAAVVTLPTAGVSFVVDLLAMSNLQLRLAYDIAVLSEVPLDLDDPEDLWRLIRVAFLLEGRGGRWDDLVARVPAFVRPALRTLFGDPVGAAESLPAMGQFLLQRHLVKFAIPGLGLPLSIAVNYWSAKVAGTQATTVFGREARIQATARRVAERAVDHAELLWVLWLVAKADGVVHENERLLLKHVAAVVGDVDSELSALAGLDLTVDFDQRPTASLPAFVSRDKEALYQAGVAAAAVDGSIDPNELSRLQKLADHCSVPFDADAVRRLALDEARAAQRRAG